METIESVTDENGHKIDSNGNLIFDEKCRGCDAPRITESQEQELVALIEAAAPGAGFYQKGKPLDFTLEDVMTVLSEDLTFTLWHSRFRHEFHFRRADSVLVGVWLLGQSLSSQSSETKLFLLNLLSPHP